jgi:hypothetical protein
MALAQSIVWTTLPYGRVQLPTGETALRVSVFVSPRLTPTAQQVLKPFDVFLNWPEVAARVRFKLVFDGGGGGELALFQPEDPLEPKLWQLLFDEDTFVRGHQFTSLKDEVIRSFPAGDVHAYVQDLYGWSAAEHGTEFPSRFDQAGPLGRLKQDLGPLNDRALLDRYEKSLNHHLREMKVLPPEPFGAIAATTVAGTTVAMGSAGGGMSVSSSQAQYAFLQARRFYERPKAPGNKYQPGPDPDFVASRLDAPEFDFHQALAALADYPRLMRRLGLVLDLVWIEREPVPAQGRVRVEVEWGDPLPAWHQKDVPPWTAYVLDRDGFRARSAAGPEAELTRGLLDLREARDAAPDGKSKPPYLVGQVDVDGSALKTLHTAGTLVRQDRPQVTNYRTPDRSDLPALRTSGLAIYKRTRAALTRVQLLRAAEAQAAFGAAGRPEFFAEDVLRGYRIDVWDDVSGAWHSLCLRRGQYRFTHRGEFELVLPDEGYVKSVSASRGEDGTPTDLYLHERLATFDGWSLVAARPGRTLAADPSEAAPVVPTEDPATEFGLGVQFRPEPGSLPRLRYGRHYRLRVRVVDLAGNSLKLKTTDDQLASQPFRYTRFEPVPSPTLLLRARVTEGESLEHLVVRSDYDRTAAAYAADPTVEAILEQVRDRVQLTGTVRADYAYRAANERHVAPPKISQLEAETHGCFDAFIGAGLDPAAGYRLAQREAGTFLSRTIVNLATGAEEGIPGLELELVPPAGAAATDLDDAERLPGDALQTGEYVLHKEAQLVVPYLPDPFAAGVAFVGLPGWPADEPYVVGFDQKWPEVRPFRLRLVERPGVLEQCAQVFADNGEPQWDPVERVLTVFQPKGVMSEVRYSSVLPGEPEAKQMGLWKWLEQRGGLTDVNRKAILTGRHWMLTPWRTLVLVHAVQHPLCPPSIRQFSPTRHLGNTHADLHGRWHLSIKSTDKVDVLATWQEPLDDPFQDTWQILDRDAQVAELKMNPLYADELEVPPPVNPHLPRMRLPLRHEFKDTKHRMVRYRLKGTTRFREYFPIELTHDDTAIARQGEEFLVNIPSSARPVAPQPLYILPTFRWEETVLPNHGVIRRRRGNGLRVYLDRPWWSSGESERLGVVFKTGTIDQNGPYKSLVTQWGLDPVFNSPAPTAGPTLGSFPLATASRSNVSLQEIGDHQDIFAVAGHDVEFDAARRLWFSDLVVQAGGSYYPFIRLALARFQPSSIEDAHLSRVVLTDFVQLVPDRTLDLRWVSANRVRVKIYGPAPTETHVSRLLAGMSTVRSATIPPPAAIKDIAQPISRAQFTTELQRSPIEAISAADLAKIPGVTAAEPASPSKKVGLNEYTIAVEDLPEGASADFGWEPVSGVSVTKPPAPPRGIDPKVVGTAIKTTTSSATGTTTRKTAASRAAATTAAKVGTQVSDVIGSGGLTTVLGLQLAPLWEGDVTLPPLNGTRPRRIVVREHELYFKATATAGEFIPIARRLVYADQVELPTPA